MVDFAGWDMPVNYGSQIEEHHAVRRDAGMFDVSHMLALDLVGAGSKAFLRGLIANDVAKLVEPGKALYSCMLNPEGGVIDDLIVYYLSDTAWRIVVNAGTADKDVAWMQARLAEGGFDAALTVRRDLAMIAVQGPNARAKTWAALPGSEAASAGLKPFQAAAWGDFFIARTGYTGEDGFELTLPADQAAATWAPSLPPASSPAASAPATPCASKPAWPSTATTWTRPSPPRRRPRLDGGFLRRLPRLRRQGRPPRQARQPPGARPGARRQGRAARPPVFTAQGEGETTSGTSRRPSKRPSPWPACPSAWRRRQRRGGHPRQAPQGAGRQSILRPQGPGPDLTATRFPPPIQRTPHEHPRQPALHRLPRMGPRRSRRHLTIGITDHAQEALGDVVFLELPEAGRAVAAEAIAVIESVKAASDIYAPVAGEIIASNQEAVDAPKPSTPTPTPPGCSRSSRPTPPTWTPSSTPPATKPPSSADRRRGARRPRRPPPAVTQNRVSPCRRPFSPPRSPPSNRATTSSAATWAPAPTSCPRCSPPSASTASTR
jgi:hypothetical protein